jgi:hypothetical protein
MCVSMSDKPFDAEACDIGGQASATNGLSEMKTPSKTHHVIDPLRRTFSSIPLQKLFSSNISYLEILWRLISNVLCDYIPILV